MRGAYVKWLALACTGLAVAGCGGSSDEGTGQISLALTDAPVDNASAVVVEFTGIEIKPAEGNAFMLEGFGDPRQINLLDLQDGESEQIINATVPAGRYNWIRLMVNADRDASGPPFASYITIDEVDYPLWVPSGDQTGLKLNRGIVVPEGGNSDYTIDFDLRKSVHKPMMNDSDTYILRPTLRIVDNTEVGSIAGSVDSTLLGENYEDGACAVYVFEGADVAPDDVDTVEGDDAEPLTSAGVKLDEESGTYRYTAAFLLPGLYTVALTCDPALDDPEADNSDVVSFGDPQNAEVFADEVTTVDFLPAAP